VPDPRPIIDITDPADPRLIDYFAVKDRQLLPEFSPGYDNPGQTLAPFGKFMAEGDVVMDCLVPSIYPPLSILGTASRLAAIAGHLAAIPPGVPIYRVPKSMLEPIVGFSLHRGLLAIGARTAPADPAALLKLITPGRPLVVLEHLSNHDNVGGCFRCAAALGAGAVMLTPGCADPLYRKALRVSAGNALKVPFALAPVWPEFLGTLHDAGITTVALTPDPSAIDLADFAQSSGAGAGRLALMLGTEGPGLEASTLQQASVRVRIAIASGVDSLNVHVACAIALHRLARV